ncbi:TonB-dependent receptor [Gluconacetobacter tumulisoli]|uniref:TonB-dependent receptor n=1 Tax=Gluconacetobacter tumulisoli TaxID=1286189 RepID=A0A7W4K9F0_9PROT|nr:TonB-dependent receptor [Gluconacetobacter tumulisoli]MBB2202782.1 TonB-dependent receptor [Gluconacetobacter tumulisoli]
MAAAVAEHVATKPGAAKHVATGQGAPARTAVRAQAARQPSRITSMEASGGAEAINISGVRHFAGGRMRHQTAAESRSSVGQQYISQQMGASSPLALLAAVPGVNFGNSDPLGLAIRQTLTVRGLGTTEMGYVLEGMQGIDQAYYQPYMETWADGENIADMTLIQGSSRIVDPTSTASGGEIILTVRDPSDKMGGHLSYSAGSYRAQRVFARLDTGYIGNSGVKMFGSYSYTAADLFTGSGRNHRTQVDYKITKDWGDYGKSSIYASYDNWYNARLNTTSLSSWEAANKVDNNFSAGNLAGTFDPTKSNSYWKPYVYKSEDALVSMQNTFGVGHGVTFHFNPYFRWEATQAPGETSVSANSLYNGDQKVSVDTSGLYLSNPSTQTFLAMSNTRQNIYAAGLNTYIDAKLSSTNTLQAGYWFDNFSLSQLGSLSPLDQNGNAANDFGAYPLRSTDGKVVSGSNFTLQQQTHALYIGDTQSFLDNKLKVSAGFREMLNYVSGQNYSPGTQDKFSNSFSAPMPRVTISYDLNPHMQVYVNGITNARAPMPSNTYTTLYNVSTGKISQQGLPSAKPEYTIGEELGFRYHGAFLASVALFNMNMTHHQIATLANVNGALVNQAISAGGETIRGVTAEVATRAYYGFSPYVNAQYVHATMDNDMVYGGQVYQTAGKAMVQTPKFMANIGVNYQHGPFFANLAFKWVDSQYSTFMNDQSMPAYKTVDVGLGYRLPSYSIVHAPVIRLNFTNLSNVHYLGSIASPTVSSKVSQPGYYLAAPMTALMTVSTDF